MRPPRLCCGIKHTKSENLPPHAPRISGFYLLSLFSPGLYPPFPGGCRAAKCPLGRERNPDAPSWGASCLLSRPEGRVAAPHPPGKGRCAPGENSDNKSKLLIWGAQGARISLFVCFMPQQRRGGRIHPGSRRTCRGKAPPSCWRKTVLSLKSPTGAFIAALRSQTRTFPRCAWRRSGHTSLHFSAGTG